MTQQTLLDWLGLVGGVVVQDQVEFEVLRDGGVDDLQEAEELLVPVAAVIWAMTDPEAMSKAANKLVVPCRT